MQHLSRHHVFLLTSSSADELNGILEGPESQSPDLGPPPISRFESEESIHFNRSPSPDVPLEESANNDELALPVNLETRKKRRESNPKLNIRRVSVFQSPPEESEEGNGKTVRVGAKRKLSVCEDEEKPSSQETEPFRFSRRNTPSNTEECLSQQNRSAQSPERCVLRNSKSFLSPHLRLRIDEFRTCQYRPYCVTKKAARIHP